MPLSGRLDDSIAEHRAIGADYTPTFAVEKRIEILWEIL